VDTTFTSQLITRRPHSRVNGGWLVPCVLVFVAGASLFVDVPLASLFKMDHKQLPKFLDAPLREALENCEVFGHGFGAFLIIVAVGVLDLRQRKVLPWIAAASLGSGLVANTVKILVRRTRPSSFDFSMGSVWSTFANAGNGGMNVQSFPSAHTATAVGLAVMLSHLYPRGRWYFGILAFLVAAQRVVSSAHFPSDVCAGAAIGWIVGIVCVDAIVLTRAKSPEPADAFESQP
jgi:hypothetical protein